MTFGSHPRMTFVALLPLSVVFSTIDHWPWYPFGGDLGSQGWVAQFCAGSLPSCQSDTSECWLEMRDPVYSPTVRVLLCEVTQGSVFSPLQHIHDTTGWDHPSLCNEVSSLGWWHYTSLSQVKWGIQYCGCSFTVPAEYVDLDGIMTNSSHWLFTLFLHISNIIFHQISLPI